MAEEFKRERRYVVFKVSDLYTAGSGAARATLEQLIDHVEGVRRAANKPSLECVVVESDWPEYETVWNMIEERCTGKPLTCDASAADRLASLESALRIKHGLLQNVRKERTNYEGLINRLLDTRTDYRSKIMELRKLLVEVDILCAIGDVDETTEAHGWGDLISRIRQEIAGEDNGHL